MRIRDLIGRRIVAVDQQRVGTNWAGDGRELAHTWVMLSLTLDNGKKLILHAVETDYDPVVTAWLMAPEGDHDQTG